MADLDDIRNLAEKDTRHRQLRNLPDGEFSGYEYFIARDGTLIPIMAILSDAPIRHPQRADGGRLIRFVVSDLSRPLTELRQAFKQCLLSISDLLTAEGLLYAWGVIPVEAIHLTGLLNLGATLGVVQRNPVSILDKEGLVPVGGENAVYLATNLLGRPFLVAA